MTCVSPDDAAGIDAMLTRASSPLAGEGATFVRASLGAGIDPRALVAIAAHETMLETYGPSQTIHNAFGLGPGIAFADEGDAIGRAAGTLAEMYLPEGRTTLATIGSKWAPIGVANDPAGLNRSWTSGVGAYYAALGGDPDLPILAAEQAAAPGCDGTPRRRPGRRTSPSPPRPRRTSPSARRSSPPGAASGPRAAPRPRTASSSRWRCRWARPRPTTRRPRAPATTTASAAA